MTVSALVLEHGGDEDQAIAGLLHDAAEDQGGDPRRPRRAGPHEDLPVSLRLRRWLGAHDQDRSSHPGRAGAHLSPSPCCAGGPWGYVDYLEAIADPDHERHAELLDWRGPGFDPNFVDANAIQIELDRLGKRLARRKAKPQRKACR